MKREFRTDIDDMDKRSRKRIDSMDCKVDNFFRNALHVFVTRSEFDDRIERLATKEDFERFMNIIDKMANEMHVALTGMKIYDSILSNLDDKAVDHEKRICVLEKTT
ncbi:hypothetical protein HYW82_04430 [Candidatus Peregrinibacteria bacterium]|nr:hypothetical protein [Candidatus Peregrinibacteria bacterium]